MITCPKSRLKNEHGEPYCSDCGQFRPLTEFRLKTSRAGNPYPETFCRVHANARRAARARELAAKERAERPARLKRIFRTPKPYLLPPPVLIQPPVKEPSVASGSKWKHKPIVLPRIDPELCVHPGALIWAADGRMLVHEFFAANVCGAIIRGWASTVDADEDGFASPRFERKATTDLWREIVANRFGVRDRIAS